MPSYTDLRTEPPPGGTAWLAQTTPANMTTYLLAPMRALYGKSPAAIGAAGDNNHLYGRHRSRDWCLTSDYCPENKRYYGTTDARDKRGAGNIYRAADIGVAGPTQWDACRRLDAAVRAGKLPGVAEWFGTFDGETVVGWYEGHASSSDDSHLTHTHLGFWNEFADDEATMRATYATFTGTGGTSATKKGDPMFAMKEQNNTAVWLTNGLNRRAGITWVAITAMHAAGLIQTPTSGTDSSGFVYVVPDGQIAMYAGPEAHGPASGGGAAGPLNVTLTGTAVPQ